MKSSAAKCILDVAALDTASEPTLDDDEIILRLRARELIPGAQGEVVLFNDSALRSVVLETTTPVVEQGLVDRHVTAEGLDVSGYAFLRFEDALLVFHTPETTIIVEELEA